MGYFVKNRGVGRSPDGAGIPTGITANRPLVPTSGLLRFNETTLLLEYYNGTNWASITTPGTVDITVDNFTGNGIVTTFTMSQVENRNEQILVFVGGVYQIPTTVYSVSNTDLIFTSAPPLGATITVVHNIGTIA